MSSATNEISHGKADFSHLYHRPDPRGYYRNFRELEYQTPHHGQPIFDKVREAQRQAMPSASETVLDVCCSYGVNAALMTTDLSLPDLYDRYNQPDMSPETPEQLALVDQEFYAEHRRQDAPEVLGLDIAAEAVSYAVRAGLLRDGWSDNLEVAEPSEALAQGVDDVSLIVLTGGVGYVTERTFDRLLGLFPDGRRPWIAAFVLRTYPYDAISDTLADYGLVTERLEGTTFPQRRFESDREQRAAVRQLHRLGLDTQGLEDDGYYHTEFFLSRPADDVEALPLKDLLAP